MWGGDMGSMHVQNLEVRWYVITLGDYIGPKKLPKYHRYRSNNRLRPNRYYCSFRQKIKI